MLPKSMPGTGLQFPISTRAFGENLFNSDDSETKGMIEDASSIEMDFYKALDESVRQRHLTRDLVGSDGAGDKQNISQEYLIDSDSSYSAWSDNESVSGVV